MDLECEKTMLSPSGNLAYFNLHELRLAYSPDVSVLIALLSPRISGTLCLSEVQRSEQSHIMTAEGSRRLS